MIETFNRLLSIVNWTNPATETKSMWVGGHRAGAVFFARHLDYFIVTQNLHPSPGLGTVKTIYRDKKLSSAYRDWQKTRHRDADGNSLNRRAVSKNAQWGRSNSASCTASNKVYHDKTDL
jgi:hypothetical protein